MIERADWLEWRSHGIGGSDAAAVCNLDPFKSAVEVWLEKTGQIPPADENPRMRWGRLLERPIADEVELEHRVYIRDRQLLRQHPGLPWMRCTLDGLIYEDAELGEPLALYEGKTTDLLRYVRWGEDDDLPVWVQLQVQHNLAVCNLDLAWVSVLSGKLRLRVIPVHRDDGLIGDLIEEEEAFWERVLSGEPPVEVDGRESTRAAIRVAYAEPEPQSSVELPPEETRELLDRRAVGKALISEGEEAVRLAENRLGMLLGDHEAGCIDGIEVVRWPRVTPGRRLTEKSVAKLRADYPGIWERYAENPEPYRRWHIPKEER
ncbi:MAG: YqaJ viral recombinase family protein [bacterium]|jgi:putative phage-type endonuclease|nr:YqaJ viral recombinase family protein [bacterium]